MRVVVMRDGAALGAAAAREIAKLVRCKPNAVLGLATGSTPLELYRELIRMHVEERLDFSSVTTFNLDEYVGLAPSHPQSYHHFMRTHLFDRINVPADRIHIPSGTAPDIEKECASYERRMAQCGGIDLQVLGIGTNGHIAFNEPGSDFASRTRCIQLTRETIDANARFFAGPDEVPRFALTMGMATIIAARRILLIATGDGKAAAIQAAIEGPVTPAMPASALQSHPDVTFYLDEAAASGLHKTALETAAS